MARTKKQQTASKARAAARQKVADHEASDEEREVVLVKWYNATPLASTPLKQIVGASWTLAF